MKKRTLIVIFLFSIGIMFIIIGATSIGGKEKQTPKYEAPSEITLEHNTIFDDGSVKIEIESIHYDEVKGLSEEYKKYEKYIIDYKVTNKLEKKISVFIHLYVNNIQTKVFSATNSIEPNTSKKGSMQYTVEDIKKYKTEQIAEMTFPITILYSDMSGTYKETQETVKTNLNNSYKQNYDLGPIVYEDDKIVARYVEIIENNESTVENLKELRLLIKNKTEEEVNLWLGNNWNINIDGVATYSTFNLTLEKNNYAFADIAFVYEKKISTINKIDMNFIYFDGKTYEKLSETSMFEIKTK